METVLLSELDVTILEERVVLELCTVVELLIWMDVPLDAVAVLLGAAPDTVKDGDDVSDDEVMDVLELLEIKELEKPAADEVVELLYESVLLLTTDVELVIEGVEYVLVIVSDDPLDVLVLLELREVEELAVAVVVVDPLDGRMLLLLVLKVELGIGGDENAVVIVLVDVVDMTELLEYGELDDSDVAVDVAVLLDEPMLLLPTLNVEPMIEVEDVALVIMLEDVIELVVDVVELDAIGIVPLDKMAFARVADVSENDDEPADKVDVWVKL